MKPTKSDSELTGNTKTLWLKALSAMELKNYGYTISLLQQVVKDEPDFLTGRQLLRKAEIGNTKGKKGFMPSFGGGSLGKKDPKDALVQAEKTLESDPGSSSGNRLLYEAAMALEMHETASFALETLHESNPKDLKLMHELAKHYYNVAESEKSLEMFNKIIELVPNDMLAIKGSKDASAQSSMKSGGWNEAKDYRDLIKNKEEAVSLEQKGRVVRSEEMIDNQLAELSAQYEQDRKNIEVVRRIATLYEQKVDFPNAVQWFEYAASLSNNTDSSVVRKAAEMRLKVTESQITEIQTWLDSVGETAEGREKQIAALAELKVARAHMLLDEARKRVEKNPTDLQLRFELGEQLFIAGKHKEAMPELQKARQSPNAKLRATNLLGQAFTELGMLDLAASLLKETVDGMLAMDAPKKDMLYTLGLVYEKMGRKDEYVECMKEIFSVDMSYKDVDERVQSSYASA